MRGGEKGEMQRKECLETQGTGRAGRLCFHKDDRIGLSMVDTWREALVYPGPERERTVEAGDAVMSIRTAGIACLDRAALSVDDRRGGPAER